MAFSRNKMRSKKIHAEEVRRILCDRFPDCFARPGEPKRPLKIGIGVDLALMIPELSSYSIALALEDYTFGRRYCAALTPGAARVGLDGKDDGFVTEAEAAHGAGRIAMFESSRQERKDAAPGN